MVNIIKGGFTSEYEFNFVALHAFRVYSTLLCHFKAKPFCKLISLMLYGVFFSFICIFCICITDIITAVDVQLFSATRSLCSSLNRGELASGYLSICVYPFINKEHFTQATLFSHCLKVRREEITG